MRILDRYIHRSILVGFLSTIFIFSLLYILIDLTDTLDEIIENKIPLLTLAKYYVTLFPIILVQTSPISCLLAALFTYSRMNNNNEVIALRVSGLNFWQIAKPAIFLGLVIAFFSFWLNERYVPQATSVSKEMETQTMILKQDKKKKAKPIANLTFYGLKNRLYFIDTYEPADQILHGITIIGHDENQNIREKIVALKGHWSGIAWKFFKLQITQFDENGALIPPIKVYEEKLMDIKETPDDFVSQRLNISAMNIHQLSDYIERFGNSGATRAITNLKVDLYQKYSLPVSSFVILLVGLPFGLMLRNRKGMTFISIGIAVGIGFLYYVVNAIALALGKGGFIPPSMAAWSAPFLFMMTGLITIQHKF